MPRSPRRIITRALQVGLALVVAIFVYRTITFQLRPTRVETPPAAERITLTREAGYLFATARVDGHEARLIVDTGARSTAISTAFADTTGLAARARLVPVVLNYQLKTDVGGHAARIKTFALGRSVYRNFDILVIDLSPLQVMCACRVDGIIGTNVLNVFPYQLELAHDVLTTGGERFTVAEQLGDATDTVAFRFSGDLPMIDVAVNDHTTAFMLDTGSPVSTIAMRDFHEARAALQALVDTHHLGALGATTNVQFGTTNILGLDLLAGRTIIVDPRTRRLAIRAADPAHAGGKPPVRETADASPPR